jgi:DNA-binding IclR family transcriptional regulator
MTELADQFGINPSTLTRLAKRLGFEGLAISSPSSSRLSPTTSDEPPEHGMADGTGFDAN